MSINFFSSYIYSLENKICNYKGIESASEYLVESNLMKNKGYLKLPLIYFFSEFWGHIKVLKKRVHIASRSLIL